jgi:hypothetical protein
MGFFDKLKSAASALTGGAAEVTLTPDGLTFDGPFVIKVSATVGDNDIQARGVYLKIEGSEEVSIPEDEVIYQRQNADPNLQRQRIRAHGRTFLIEYPVADGQVFQAGQTYEWAVSVTLPDGAPGLYEGRFARHEIKAMAGIDMSGNDPDSGWMTLRVG